MKKTKLIVTFAIMLITIVFMGCNSALEVDENIEQNNSEIENLDGQTALVIELPESTTVKSDAARMVYAVDDATSYILELYFNGEKFEEKTAFPGDNVIFKLRETGTYTIYVTSYNGEKQLKKLSGVVHIGTIGKVLRFELGENLKEVELNVNVNWNIQKNDLLKNDFVFVEGSTVTGGTKYDADGNNDFIFIPGRTVKIENFYICDHEVTQSEYYEVMGKNPSYSISGAENGKYYENRPVEGVSWFDAIIYCNKKSINDNRTPCYSINGKTNPDEWGTKPITGAEKKYNNWNTVTCDFTADGYRLPTEIEWEYAAIGGKNGASADNPTNYAGTDNREELGDYAWFSGNNIVFRTRDIKQKKANALGLYDMSGSVGEFCWDWCEPISENTPVTGEAPVNYWRVVRGGSYAESAKICTVSYRDFVSPYFSNEIIGFRVVCSNN